MEMPSVKCLKFSRHPQPTALLNEVLCKGSIFGIVYKFLKVFWSEKNMFWFRKRRFYATHMQLHVNPLNASVALI